jgi:polyisoprenoid-binding protein YceI
MFQRVLLSLASTLVWSGVAWAAPPTWKVDPARSSLQFVVDVNGQTVTGTWPGFGALIAFDPADLAHSSVKVTMDMTGVKSGDATRDAMLLKPDWFNALDFPQAKYEATSFTVKGGNAYEANGKLTLKGVTKTVVLPFTLSITGDTAVAKGEVTLKRAEFGVGKGGQFDTDKPVALGVKVLVNVTAKRAK